MTSNLSWENELLKEKSLTQVLSASKEIAKSRFNTAIRSISLIGAAAYIVVNATWGAANEPIVNAIVRTAPAVFGAAATILGFLIAGFSIFASMASKSLFKVLAQTPHKATSLSELKYMFFNFINVFTIYLFLLVVSGSLLFIAPLGPSTPLTSVVAVHNDVLILLNSAVLSAFACLWVESALRLKSFIWSFYQSVLVAVILDPEDDQP